MGNLLFSRHTFSEFCDRYRFLISGCPPASKMDESGCRKAATQVRRETLYSDGLVHICQNNICFFLASGALILTIRGKIRKMPLKLQILTLIFFGGSVFPTLPLALFEQCFQTVFPFQICPSVLGRADYQLGRTKVFLKDAQDLFLEQERDRVLTKKIQVLQRCIRGWYHRRRFLKMRAAAIVIQVRFEETNSFPCKKSCISFVLESKRTQKKVFGIFLKKMCRQSACRHRVYRLFDNKNVFPFFSRKTSALGTGRASTARCARATCASRP